MQGNRNIILGLYFLLKLWYNRVMKIIKDFKIQQITGKLAIGFMILMLLFFGSGIVLKFYHMPTTADSMSSLGNTYWYFGEFRKAKFFFQRAFDWDVKKYGEMHSKMARRWHSLGLTLRELGETEKSIRFFQKALLINIKEYGEDHCHVAINRMNLGRSFHQLGQYKKAIECYREGMSCLQKDKEEFKLDIGRSWYYLGDSWRALGKNDKAIEFFETAMQIYKENEKEYLIEVADIWLGIGNAQIAKGEFEEAFKSVTQAKVLSQLKYGVFHPRTAPGWINQANVWELQENIPGAINYYRIAIMMLTRFNVLDMVAADAMYKTGMLYDSIGKKEEAEEFYRKSVYIFEIKLGKNHYKTIAAKEKLGKLNPEI